METTTETNRLESTPSTGSESHADPPAGEFRSILFPAGDPDPTPREPPCFGDLHLDQVVAAIVGRHDEYRLETYFHIPLRSRAEVAYRHEVFRDLQGGSLRTAVRVFADEMRTVRAYLGRVGAQRHRLETQRWLLDAALRYCGAAGGLRESLGNGHARSRGLRAACAYLASYVASAPFAALAADARRVAAGLDTVGYTVRVKGGRVTVAAHDGEEEYTTLVEQTFDRFRDARAESHLVAVPDPGSMSQVEAEIAERVARLFPAEFRALDDFCAAHGEFLDPVIARFDREVQFYLAYLEHLEGLAPLPVSYPTIVPEWGQTQVEDGWDIALAGARPWTTSSPIVRNGFTLAGPERVLVVTGPNQGGKTTFARMVGQVHYLAALGAPVPAAHAALVLSDGIFTVFGTREEIATLRGRLDDELVRLRAVLDQATDRSLILLNEVFASTAVADAVFLGREILTRIAKRGCAAVWVTFIDELSSVGEETVSLVAGVEPDDPATRTFVISRRPADGRAYAWAIAEKYGLSYVTLKRRLAG